MRSGATVCHTRSVGSYTTLQSFAKARRTMSVSSPKECFGPTRSQRRVESPKGLENRPSEPHVPAPYRRAVSDNPAQNPGFLEVHQPEILLRFLVLSQPARWRRQPLQ